MGGIRRIVVTSALVAVVVVGAVGSFPSVASASAPKAGHVAAAQVAAATPSSAPQVPFIQGVIPEGLSVLVNWSPNQSSDEVTGYTVTATVASGFSGKVSKKCALPPVVSAPGTDSSALMAKLCAGVPYSVSMTATNVAGTSGPSGPSNPAVPLVAQPPSAPLVTSVLSLSGGLVVNWSAPSIPGGDALKSYLLTTTTGTTSVNTKANKNATQLTLSKLTNGTSYTLSLVAISKAGESAPGTNTGTPSAATPPDVPQSLQVVPDGSGHLIATWSAPGYLGSDPVSGYTVTTQAETETSGVWSPTGSPSTQTLGATASTATIGGLSTTGFYAVSVVATSAAGSGPAATTSNPVTPTVQLASSSVVLTQATMNALTSDDSSGTLTWNSPAPSQVTSLATGDVLVGPTSTTAPNGLLVTVTGVTNTSGTYVLTTTTASLSDAFSNLSFGFSGDPLAQSGSTFEAQAAGVRKLHPDVGGGITYDKNVTLGVNVGPVTGQVNLDAQLALSAEVHTHFAIPDGVSLSASATVTATAGLDDTLSGSKTWPLGEIDSAPIDIQIGPVPLILVPKVPVFLTASGSISVGVEASMTVGAGVSWSSQNPNTLTTRNLTTRPHMDGSGPLPGVSATATGSVTLTVQPQIGIYDAAGPNVEAVADLTADVNFLGSPYFTLTPTITLKAGLDFDILDGLFHGSLDATLGTFDFPAFVIESAPNATLAISPANPTVVPGTPTTFTTTRSDGKSDPVTWSLKGAATGDSITSGGVLTVVNPIGRTLTVIARDSTGATGQTTVTVGAAFDPVSGLSAEQESNSLDADVSWDAPDATGSAPISHYTVTTSNGIATQTTTGGGVTLTGLHPGITYVVTVYPTNTAGQTGPSATTSFQVIPLCTDTFTGGKKGTATAWSTASNWSGGYVPGPSDWVCDNGFSITLPSGTTTVQGFQQSGTTTIPSADGLVVGNTYIDNGILTGGGTLTLPTGTESTLATSTLLMGGSKLINKGTGTVEGFGNDFVGGSTLENAGTLVMTDGSGLLDDGGGNNGITNDAGATITYNGSSSGNSADIGVSVQDNGAVDVGAGILAITLQNTGGSPSFTGPGSVDISGSTTGLAGFTASNLATLQLGGSIEALPSDTSLAGIGSLEFSGEIQIPSTFVLTGVASFTDNGVITGGTLTLPATLQSTLATSTLLMGGSKLINKGTATVEGFGNDFVGGSTLENAGTLVMTDGSGLLDDGGGNNGITNDAGATITYNGSSSGNSADIGVSVQDNGAVDVGAGILAITLQNTGGSPSFTGPGSVDISGSTTGLAGFTASNLATLQLGGSIEALPSDTSLAGIGSLEFSGEIQIPSTFVLTGVASFTDNGVITGGTLTLPATLQSTLATSTLLMGGSKLINKGTATVEGFGNDFVGGSTLENAGTLVMTDGSGLLDDGGGNNGITNDAGATITYNGSSSGNSADIGVSVQDNGAVDVGAGILAITLQNTGGSPSFTGPGSVDISGSTTGLAGFTASNLATLQLGGSIEALPSDTSLAGIGSLEFSGEIQIPSTFVLTGVASFTDNGVITGGTLTLPATLQSTLATSTLLMGGSKLINKGTATVEGFGNDFVGGSTLENAGTLVMTDGSGLLDDGGGNNGITNDAGATITYNGSSSGNSADIGVSVQDNGAVDVGEGTLNLPTYGPASGSTLTVGVSTTPGQLSVSGAATLKGTLAIATKAGYLPAIGTKVAILTASSISGTFSTVTGAQLTGEHWVVSYKAKSVVLTATSG